MHPHSLADSRVGIEAERDTDEASLSSLLPVASLISAAFAASVIVAPLYPLYQQKFRFSEIVLTFIYAAYVVGNVVALLFFGQVSDQLGRKRVGLPALALAGVGALVLLFAASTASLYVGRLLIGLAVGVASGTGTAWLTERTLRQRATVIATVANLSGVAIGPVLGGLLAQYEPRPLELPFIVYLALLVGVAVMIARTSDSTEARIERLRDLHIRPGVGLPSDHLGRFVPPAITGFTIFSLGGLYFALIPTVMIHDLHQRNASIAGAVVAELALMAIAAVIWAQRLTPHKAMRMGLTVLMPAVGLLVVAQAARSMLLLALATALAGLGLGVGYLGSLNVVNELAPDEHRGAVASSYFLACFVGNAIPVIGVGVLSTLTTSLTASIALACTLIGFCLATLALSRDQHRTNFTPTN